MNVEKFDYIDKLETKLKFDLKFKYNNLLK